MCQNCWSKGYGLLPHRFYFSSILQVSIGCRNKTWGNKMTDQALLLAGLLDGDRRAFNELVTTYGGRLHTKAMQLLGDHEDASDCVQECFIQVHRHIGTFREDAQLSSWMHRILINACLSKIRSRARHLAERLEACEKSQGGDCQWALSLWQNVGAGEEVMEAIGLQKLVLAKIDELPQNYRSVLFLRDIQGYSTAEVAGVLSLSKSATKVRLHRARAMLKTKLEPYYHSVI